MATNVFVLQTPAWGARILFESVMHKFRILSEGVKVDVWKIVNTDIHGLQLAVYLMNGSFWILMRKVKKSITKPLIVNNPDDSYGKTCFIIRYYFHRSNEA